METLEDIKGNEIFTKEYRRKKTIAWLIRTIIAVVLFVVFWEHKWVRIVSYIYIPISILGLGFILIFPYYLKKKQEKIEKQLNEL